MKRTGRRTISIVLSVIMLLSCFAGLTFSAGAETSGDYEYSVIDNSEICLDKYLGSDTDIIIPSDIESIPVTRIGIELFKNRFDIKSVELPNTITEIGSDAFYGCTGLTEITLPESVKSIGYSAFSRCSGLKTVTIPKNTESVMSGSFSDCKNLENIYTDPDNASYVSVDGVLFNKDMTELVAYPGKKAGAYTVPGSVTAIENGAFDGCSNMTELSIGANVSEIHWFLDCPKLESINVDDNNQCYVSVDGVLYNKDITELTWYPAGRKGAYTVPDTLTDFDLGFWKCGELTEIYIPAGVTNIQTSPLFFECGKLQNIFVDEKNPNYTSVDGVLFNKDKTVLMSYPQGRGGDYVIPDTVTSIYETAFYRNPTITGIFMPDSITDISGRAFVFCPALTKVRISENVTSILCFYECHSLKEIVVPKSVTHIEELALGYHGDDELCSEGVKEPTKIDGFTIYGYKDSAAQEYAEENGFKFVMLEDVCSHENTVVKNASEADCTNDGYTGDVYCADCSEKLSDGEKIPAFGHTDKNNDGICDYCKKTMPEVENCECICHKDGFAGFMYKLIKFIWRLFGIKKTCDCGLAHY